MLNRNWRWVFTIFFNFQPKLFHSWSGDFFNGSVHLKFIIQCPNQVLSPNLPYCWWNKSGYITSWGRLVVYPIIYTGFLYIQTVVWIRRMSEPSTEAVLPATPPFFPQHQRFRPRKIAFQGVPFRQRETPREGTLIRFNPWKIKWGVMKYMTPWVTRNCMPQSRTIQGSTVLF